MQIQYLFLTYMLSRVGITALRITVPKFYSLVVEELIICAYVGLLCYFTRVREAEIVRLKMTADGRMMIVDNEAQNLAKIETKDNVNNS